MEIRKVRTCDLQKHKFSQGEMLAEFKHCLETTLERVNNGEIPLGLIVRRMSVLEQMLFDAAD